MDTILLSSLNRQTNLTTPPLLAENNCTYAEFISRGNNLDTQLLEFIHSSLFSPFSPRFRCLRYPQVQHSPCESSSGKLQLPGGPTTGRNPDLCDAMNKGRDLFLGSGWYKNIYHVGWTNSNLLWFQWPRHCRKKKNISRKLEGPAQSLWSQQRQAPAPWPTYHRSESRQHSPCDPSSGKLQLFGRPTTGRNPDFIVGPEEEVLPFELLIDALLTKVLEDAPPNSWSHIIISTKPWLVTTTSKYVEINCWDLKSSNSYVNE